MNSLGGKPLQSQLLSYIKRMITVTDSVMDHQFTLLIEDDKDDSYQDDQSASNDEQPKFNASENQPKSRRPMSLRQLIDKGQEEYHEAVAKSHAGLDDDLPADIDEMKQELERFFHVPENKDIVIREFGVGVDVERPWRGLVVFIDGMADKTTINTAILEPLMLLTHVAEDDPKRNLENIMETLLPGNQSSLVETWKEVVSGVLTGSSIVLLDDCEGGIMVETKGWEHRNVSTPQTENVVRGSQDAFTESFRANTGLVRARLRSEHLVTEILSVGNIARTDIGVMYLHGIANPRLVKEVRRRLEAIDIDFVGDSGVIEQFIEDRPRLLLPQVLSTERPDRVASSLAEGYVAMFVGNSPYVLIVPVVLFTMVHTSEDINLRFPAGSFIRGLRWIAIAVALLLPSLYIGITNYHPEMVPTDLMLTIAGSREQVPFPAIVEILLMEFAIELIREAGIRIPSVIGPTIGIVGALIIGQSAVQAGIVSPLLVIVVATTALATFAIPNYGLGMAVRIGRFFFLLASAIFGFYGISILLCVMVVRLSMQKSFGVPILSPLAPSSDNSGDVFLRGPVYRMDKRPAFLNPLRSWRQQPITRPWSPITRTQVQKRKKGGRQS